MPLNYSKWDQLELSDDSDIEGHPNVDHKSLVRWKQRDIHEKREARNAKIAALRAEIACNDVLLPRLRTITEEVHAASDGPQYFSRLVERLKTQPSLDAPPTNASNKVTYDEMILSLLLKVWEDAKEKGVDKNDERLRETLIVGLKFHVTKLGEEQEKIKKDLEAEEREKHKKITTEDIKEGWESKYIPPKPEPAPVKGIKVDEAKKKETAFEVINPKGVEAGKPVTLQYNDDDELPQMTPNLTEFSKIPLRGYAQSFEFIQSHRDIYVSGASDALLVAAFTAQGEGKSAYAKQCVHQSLLLQYCEKLGPDGPRVFFTRMTHNVDRRAEMVFLKDVEDTYAHLVKRVQVSKDEEAAGLDGTEQIQLVPEHPGQQISFTVPDGPPPAELRLEGPGTEKLDIEQVRRALQMRWDVYQGFSEELKEALKASSLERVNKVLGAMTVEEAEHTVQLLDQGGILNFAEGGIRDQTGKPVSNDDGDEADNADDEDADDEEGNEE